MNIKSLTFALLLVFTFGQLYSDQQNKDKVGIEEKLGSYIPLDLKFANSTGDTLSLGQIITKPTILSLVYFHCPGICSPLLNALVDGLDKIQMEQGKDFNTITISFDHKETPAIADKWKKNYLNEMTRKIDPKSWYFMVGDSMSIRKLTQAIGFYFKSDGQNDYIHSGSIYAISPKGMISRYLYFDKFFNPFDMKMALTEANDGKFNPTINTAIQYCYSYDPINKKYVFNTTRVIGTVMLLSAATFFIVLVRLGRKKTNNNKLSEG